MRFSISRTILKLIVLAGWLYITNPQRSDLLQSIKTSSTGNFLKNIVHYFGYSVKNYFTGDVYRDYRIVSFFNLRNKESFYLGLSGFWISSDFWMTISGTALVANLFVNLILDHAYLLHCWFEVIVSSLFYCFMSMQLVALVHSNQIINAFIVTSFVLSYVIANYGLYKLRLFVDRSNPSSHIYAVASAALTFIACHERSIRWNGIDLECGSVVIGLLLCQLLLGHGAGFAGSLSGFLLSYLQQTHGLLS